MILPGLHTIPVCLLLSVSACAVWAQGDLIGNCWVDAPQVSETSVRIDMDTQQTTAPDGGTRWNVNVRLSWQRPAGMEPEDMYILDLKPVGEMTNFESVMSDPCQVNNNEVIVGSEEYVFHNLSFGQFYELAIYLYRPTRQQKSIASAMAAFETPDCFHVTGDMDLCMKGVAIEYSGAPMEPQVNNLCRNATSGLYQISLSWLPPFQVNGEVALYVVMYGLLSSMAPDVFVDPASFEGMQAKNVTPPATGNESIPVDFRLTTNLEDLEGGKLYFVSITPFVNASSEGGIYPGLSGELTFLTANSSADPSTQTTGTNLATPICGVGGDETTISVLSSTSSMTTDLMASKGTEDTSPMATTPAKLPPGGMEPAHIALIVIFTILILAVIIVFIVITMRMAKSGESMSKMPSLSKVPAMCKRSKPEGDEKKKDLNMVEKGAKPSGEKNSQKVSKAATS
ncbi:uncharacterized protein [Diadema antillarum]|uniref:uncharacterized protein n=2 Tax=Diadema antillarum TaxID=105358 RepID=UPI003A87C420